MMVLLLDVLLQELWKTRTPPSPLSLPELLPDLQPAVTAAVDGPALSASRALGLKDQTTWSNADNARVFLTAIVKFLTQRKQELGSAVFDKDDDLAVSAEAAVMVQCRICVRIICHAAAAMHCCQLTAPGAAQHHELPSGMCQYISSSTICHVSCLDVEVRLATSTVHIGTCIKWFTQPCNAVPGDFLFAG
jgi:hypothetical protein